MKIIRNASFQKTAALILMMLCVFQNPMMRIWDKFKWIDECLCLAAFVSALLICGNGSMTKKECKRHVLSFLPFAIYMLSNLLGSFIFQYQPWKPVLIDAFANAKFWLTLYGFFVIGTVVDGEAVNPVMLRAAKVCIFGMFPLFLFELAGYGDLEQAWIWGDFCQLFYGHVTYYVAALIFLLAVVMAFWGKRSWIYAGLTLIMVVFSFRSKAYAAVLVYVGLTVFTVLAKQKIRLWHIVLAGIAAIGLAWDKIYYYFIYLAGWSARSILTSTSIIAMKDHFPFGTGFATFGSHQASLHYSPLYHHYGFTEGFGTNRQLGIETRLFLNDTFWPIVIAQSGPVGLAAYITMLLLLCKKVWAMYSVNICYYAASLFCGAYLLISSTSESAFNNALALPLAVLMGYLLGQTEKIKKERSAS